MDYNYKTIRIFVCKKGFYHYNYKQCLGLPVVAITNFEATQRFPPCEAKADIFEPFDPETPSKINPEILYDTNNPDEETLHKIINS